MRSELIENRYTRNPNHTSQIDSDYNPIITELNKVPIKYKTTYVV